MGFLLLGGIHHGNMTFIAPLQLANERYSQTKHFTFLSALAAELEITQHSVARSLNSRQNLKIRCNIYFYWSYLVFDSGGVYKHKVTGYNRALRGFLWNLFFFPLRSRSDFFFLYQKGFSHILSPPCAFSTLYGSCRMLVCVKGYRGTLSIDFFMS